MCVYSALSLTLSSALHQLLFMSPPNQIQIQTLIKSFNIVNDTLKSLRSMHIFCGCVNFSTVWSDCTKSIHCTHIHKPPQLYIDHYSAHLIRDSLIPNASNWINVSLNVQPNFIIYSMNVQYAHNSCASPMQINLLIFGWFIGIHVNFDIWQPVFSTELIDPMVSIMNLLFSINVASCCE